MSTQLIKFDNELTALPPSKAEQIKATFEPMVEMLQSFEEKVNEVITEASQGVTPEISARAKRLRLDIAKVRIAADKVRKAEKDEYLRAGNAIQGVYNVLAWAVSDRENKLEEIEKHAERIEAERLARLQSERVELLSPYVDDAETRDLASMDAEAWEFYLAGKKQQHIDLIEAERKAEAERIAREKAEAAERERIRKENERLKAEAEEKERALAAERAKVEAERKAAEEKARKEREEAERVARAERERIEREAAERLATERAERAKLEAELKAKAEAEDKARADEAARIESERKAAEKLAKAPVKKQLATWVNSFELPETNIHHQTARDIEAKFKAFKSWAITQIEEI
jgi:colicin import membrane protein